MNLQQRRRLECVAGLVVLTTRRHRSPRHAIRGERVAAGCITGNTCTCSPCHATILVLLMPERKEQRSVAHASDQSDELPHCKMRRVLFCCVIGRARARVRA